VLFGLFSRRGREAQPPQLRQLPPPLSAPQGSVSGVVRVREASERKARGGILGLLLRPALGSAGEQLLTVSCFIASLPGCLRGPEGRVIGVGFTPAAVPLAGLGRTLIGQFTS
jgi:hypothetical protein